MHVVIIGGTGHIGSFLTPRLVEAGHAVTCISRGMRQPYFDDAAWRHVARIETDRQKEEAAGTFGERIARLDADVVIDLTCYTLDSARQLVDALRGAVGHLLHCGTIWVHGPSSQVPTAEDAPRRPFGDYGCRKAAIESYLLSQAQRAQFPVTILHPGHLVGPGWNPINPAGNSNPQVFSDLAVGAEVPLPNLGMETVHHVHADDVAQAFVKAMSRPSVAIGESFHVVSPAALTLRGYAEAMAEWFGAIPDLRFLSWEEWSKTVSEKDASFTWDHIAHSPNCSIQKARDLLDFEPRYSSLQAVRESVSWLMQKGIVTGRR